MRIQEYPRKCDLFVRGLNFRWPDFEWWAHMAEIDLCLAPSKYQKAIEDQPEMKCYHYSKSRGQTHVQFGMVEIQDENRRARHLFQWKYQGSEYCLRAQVQQDFVVSVLYSPGISR